MYSSKFDKERFLAQPVSVLTHSQEVTSLWYYGHGNWQKAHDLVDGLAGSKAERIHAYLHRKEGDIWNAKYWYRRAGLNMPSKSLDEEWLELCKTLI